VKRIKLWLGAVLAIAIAIGLVRLVSDDGVRPVAPAAAAAAPANPVRPVRPPGPNDPKPRRVAEPAMPQLTPEWRAELAVKVQGTARPGETAFRMVSDRYVDDNLAFAERQAAAERLTLPEVRELTYFGLLVLATQRHDDVEALIGRPLTEQQSDELARLMQSSNGEFRDAMRGLVARGAAEAERWALIRSTDARYRSELFRITGLDAALLDDLLAGNLALPGAPAGGEPPAAKPVSGERDESTSAESPRKPRR